MLYLHCGWPRTGTTSLQTALHRHRDRLAVAGIIYPDRWRSEVGPTHHGLSEVLRASLESEQAFDEFTRFLAMAEGDVLLSAEVLTYWLVPRERLDAFVKFLSVAREITPVRCIWTLRRYDELMRSLYLLQLKRGAAQRQSKSDRPTLPDERFAGLRRVEEAVDGDVVYVEYDREGRHNEQLLRAFGVESESAARICETLSCTPRRHAAPSHKQAVALLEVDALSARAGLDLDEATLRTAFAQQGFAFEDDRPCELTDPVRQRELREAALAAARRHGVSAYVEFFEHAEVDAEASVVASAEAITDADLKRLVCFLGLSAPAGR